MPGHELLVLPASDDEQQFDRLQIVRGKLQAELAQAEAPLTNMRVASVLETESGAFYTGHNSESSSPDGAYFDHAEQAAMREINQDSADPAIKRVYMAGHGQSAAKRISPCADCFALLAPVLAPDAELVLFQPTTHDEALVLDSTAISRSYGRKPYSEIRALERADIAEELLAKTALRGKDVAVVADLRLAGLHSGMQLYLTGSASGRGWVSNVIHDLRGTSYQDIDIIAADLEDPAAAVAMVYDVLSQYHDDVSMQLIDEQIWRVNGPNRGNRARHIFRRFRTPVRQLVDLVVAPTLVEGMDRADYLVGNFWHRLA